MQAIIEYWQGSYFYLFGGISIASNLHRDPELMLWNSLALAMIPKHTFLARWG